MSRNPATLKKAAERTQRLRAALTELLCAGEQWESEIQEEIAELDEEGRRDFFYEAVCGCDLLSGILRNVMVDEDRKKEAAAAGGAR
jgi:hypothetical protein